MARSLALIHTVVGLVPVFDELLRRHLPEWQAFNIVDESLLRNTIRDSQLTPQTRRRLAGHVWSAVDAGAEAILVTCSSLGPAVESTRPMCPVPLVRVDEGMANAALDMGERIGVLATLSTTLEPTVELIRNRALVMQRTPHIVARVCDGAFQRLSTGDREGHDRLVLHGLKLLAVNVDVVVLAQASMARVLGDEHAASIGIPVLSSPELGIAHFKSQLPS